MTAPTPSPVEWLNLTADGLPNLEWIGAASVRPWDWTPTGEAIEITGPRMVHPIAVINPAGATARHSAPWPHERANAELICRGVNGFGLLMCALRDVLSAFAAEANGDLWRERAYRQAQAVLWVCSAPPCAVESRLQHMAACGWPPSQAVLLDHKVVREVE
jgi:hypothetical protein